MTSTRAVLFDLDETLFDHTYAARCALSALRDRHEALQSRPLEELEQEALRLLNETHPRVLQGLVTVDQARIERFERLFAYCGAEVSQAEILQHAARYRSTYQVSRRPVPGAVPLLEQLSGRAVVGIVSNNLTEEQQDKLRCTGIDRLIDFLVTSEDAGAIKPDPAIFQEALSRAGCRAGEAVMVGDSWESDVLGARNAGIRPVWFNRTGRPCPDPALADEIQSFEPADQIAALLLRSSAA